MCYELEGWHWKARAKALHKAELKARPVEQKAEPAKPVVETERKRPEAKEPEATV